MNREFAGAGAEEVSADADVVAEVEQFVEFESFVADGIFLDVNLQLLAALLQVSESGFAHQANGHDASGHADVDARLFEFFGSLLRVCAQNLLERVGEFVLAAVGGLAQGLDLFQLFAAQVVNMIVECQGSPLGAGDGREIINNVLGRSWECSGRDMTARYVRRIFFHRSRQSTDSFAITLGGSVAGWAKYWKERAWPYNIVK